MDKTQKLFENYKWIGEVANKTIIELKKTSDMLEEKHNIFFNKYDLSLSKFNLLVILYNDPDGCLMLSEIGKLMLVTRSNITGLIDRLEKQGFVARQRHKEDRRIIMSVLTEQGREITKKIIDEYKTWSKNSMAMLNDDEKREMINLLKKTQRSFIG